MPDPIALTGRLDEGRDGFLRVTPPATGATIGELRIAGFGDATVRVLHPFSWDAKFRGLTVDELPIGVGRTLVSGPYAAADAAALAAGADFDLRPDDGTDMTRYLAHGRVAEADDTIQDAAGWCTIAGTAPDGSPITAAIAVDYSGTTLTRLSPEGDGLAVTLELPPETFSPVGAVALPGAFVRVGTGGHDEAELWLRELIRGTIPARAGGPLVPPLIADTWGFGEDIDPERIAAFFDVARDLGVEVVTVDKGWEEHVGDWVARAGYGGVSGLAELAHDRDLRLGLWVGAGNASPDSEVAREHPDWLTTWRGQRPLLSFRNRALCLGHEPAREYLLGRLDALVRDGMDWLLHDFETIPRCDSTAHSHDPGAGEDAAVRGWYTVLAELRRRHPALVIENCWNGGRPLDLQMIAHHDTSIGDDWCRVETNRVAKLGLGRYLPSSWCTAYMSDEHLPLRAQVAPYAVGGPWVLMGDLPGWDSDQRATMEAAIGVYLRWRTADPTARIVEPRMLGTLAGVATAPRADGSQLAAFVVGADDVGVAARWLPPLVGEAIVTDEWTGASWTVTADEVAAGIPLDTTEPTGLLLSARPVSVRRAAAGDEQHPAREQ